MDPRALFVANAVGSNVGFCWMLAVNEDGSTTFSGGVGQPPSYIWPLEALKVFADRGIAGVRYRRNGEQVMPNSLAVIGERVTGILSNSQRFPLGQIIGPEQAYRMLCAGAAMEDHFPVDALVVALGAISGAFSVVTMRSLKEPTRTPVDHVLRSALAGKIAFDENGGMWGLLPLNTEIRCGGLTRRAVEAALWWELRHRPTAFASIPMVKLAPVEPATPS